MAEIETVLIPDNLETPINTRKGAGVVKFQDASASFDTIAETPFADGTPASLHVKLMGDSTSKANKNSTSKVILRDLETPPKQRIMSQMMEHLPSPDLPAVNRPHRVLSPSFSEVTGASSIVDVASPSCRKEDLCTPTKERSHQANADTSVSQASIKPKNLLFSDTKSSTTKVSGPRKWKSIPSVLSLKLRDQPRIPVTRNAHEEKAPRRLPDTPDSKRSQPGRIVAKSQLRDDASWCNSSICPFDCVEEYGQSKNIENAKPKREKMSLTQLFGFLKKTSVSNQPASKDLFTPGQVPGFIGRRNSGLARELRDTEKGIVGKDAEIDATVGPSRSYGSEDDLQADGQGKSSTQTQRSGKKVFLWIMLLALLLAIVVCAGLLAKKMFGEKKEITTVISSVTSAPAADFWWNTQDSNNNDEQDKKEEGTGLNILPPGGFFSSTHHQCSKAQELKENSMIYDSMSETTWDDTTNSCGDSMDFGFATWYSFVAEESTFMQASTCNNADFDTQITVLSGHCGELNCVTFNDNACGDQSQAIWFAEKGVTYFVAVSGYRDDWGEYTLTMQPTTINDQCNDAGIPLKLGEALSGTTSGAASDQTLESCDDVDISNSGVWYQVKDVDGPVITNAIGRALDFSGQVSVYDGTCDQLVCMAGSKAGSVSWTANRDSSYLVYVNGADSEGDFDLFFGRDAQKDTCRFADSLLPSSFAFIGDTQDTRQHNVQSCGIDGISHSAPGMWFNVKGTGNYLTASTCSYESVLDAEISIFRGSCDNLECIDGTGDALPCEGGVTWETTKEEEYFIYVSGRGSRVGKFWLTVIEEDAIPVKVETGAPTETVPGSVCSEPLALESFTPKTKEYLGSTALGSALGSEIPLFFGGNVASSRGVWYEVEGSGSFVEVSTCKEGMKFDSRISLFSGDCGSLRSVGKTAACGGDSDSIKWQSAPGQAYLLFVHGPNVETIGEYNLMLTEIAPPNDQCDLSLSIDTISNTYFGSSLEATLGSKIKAIELVIEDAGKGDKPAKEDKNAKLNGAIRLLQGTDSSCVDVPASRGLWYKVIGNGDEIAVSTCSDETDFNTVIDVFAGSCGEPQCVTSNDDSCGERSLVQFVSQAGVPYYIYVRGVDKNTVGNFSLNIDVTTPTF
jgi:hypothetical protein